MESDWSLGKKHVLYIYEITLSRWRCYFHMLCSHFKAFSKANSSITHSSTKEHSHEPSSSHK